MGTRPAAYRACDIGARVSRDRPWRHNELLEFEIKCTLFHGFKFSLALHCISRGMISIHIFASAQLWSHDNKK